MPGGDVDIRTNSRVSPHKGGWNTCIIYEYKSVVN